MSEVDRLLADADVLATSEPVDGDLLDRFPNLVVVVITPYGLTGPYATWQATDAVIAATAAQAFKAGASDREPLPPPGRFCDHVASATAAFAMLCALRHRNVNGVRSVLDFSVNEAVAQMSDWSLPNGIARQQVGQAEEASKGIRARVSGIPLSATVMSASSFFRRDSGTPCAPGWASPTTCKIPPWTDS